MNPVRWSSLKNILRSPAHYQHYLLAGVDETPAMRVGALVHHLLLGGTRQFAKYASRRYGNDWEEFKRIYDGYTILNTAEYALAEKIAHSVRRHTLAMELLEGTRERTVRWQIGGRVCEGTPDTVADHLSDLKVTNDANPNRFAYHSMRMGWVAQLSWYRFGLKQNATEVWPVYIVAVESKPPFTVQPYQLSEGSLEYGDRKWREAWERLRYCEENDYWPGYSEGLAVLDVPDETNEAFIADEEETSEPA